MNAPEQQIVADHDGTFTDSTREAETYQGAFQEQFAEVFQIPVAQVVSLFEAAEKEVRADPVSYGWRVGDLIVAPATADHILLMQSCAGVVIKELEWTHGISVPKESSEIERLLSQLYKNSYVKAGTVYREGAQEIIRDLHATSRFSIVTNSRTDAVREKLRLLFANTDFEADQIHLVGNAKKWSIDLAWDVVEMKTQPEGFPRAIQLRRKDYASVLQSLPRPVGVVAGDIYELDLALPERLGIYTILITSPFTAPWELEHYEHHLNGKRVQTLFELRDAIDQMV